MSSSATGYEMLSVIFGDDAISVEYADVDAQGTHYSEIRRMILPREHFGKDIEALEQHVADMINDAYSAD